MVCSCVGGRRPRRHDVAERSRWSQPGSTVGRRRVRTARSERGAAARSIAGASTIIAIDPIRVRRELALKLGATHALDPNVEGNNLVARVRELTRTRPIDSGPAAARSGGLLGGAGADFVIEAVGADAVPPKLEAGPDPTGILPMRQAYEMTAPGGHIVTTSLPRGNITLPGVLFSIGGRTHHAGQAGGSQPMRDIPRYVEMLDEGQFNARALATTVVRLEDMLRRLRAGRLPDDRDGDHDGVIPVGRAGSCIAPHTR